MILLGDPLIDGPSKMVHLRVDLTKVRLAQGSPYWITSDSRKMV